MAEAGFKPVYFDFQPMILSTLPEPFAPIIVLTNPNPHEFLSLKDLTRCI